jgi:aminoglycoside 6'-N-acetyltransferase
VHADLLADDESEVFAVEAGGDVIGLLLLSEELEPEYRHASLDITLASDAQGQGLGPEALRVAARHLFDERGHHRLTIDPATDNIRAIRAYERVGFRPVGVMRLYERAPDGTWHDGLLMDILAADLEG